MTPELALAIGTCVNDSAVLVLQLLKKIKQVVQFKSKCRALAREAKVLEVLLDKRREAIDGLATVSEIRAWFSDVDEFVNSCLKLSVTGVALEVFVRKTYPTLLKRIAALKDVFLLESVSEVLAREGEMFYGMNTLHTTIAAGFSAQHQILEELRTQNQLAEARTMAAFSLPQVSSGSFSKALFIANDFEVTYNESNTEGQATHPTLGPVTCYKVQTGSASEAALEIYRRVQYGAHCQRFYGLIHAQRAVYAVMESVDGLKTLSDAISSQAMPQSLVDRLQLAYDIAKSVAWLHMAKMLLKSIADGHVVLKLLPSSRYCAVLTGLQSARHFLELSSGISYDMRYEAYEFQALGEHSTYTDIFALGTIIWQTATAQFPHGFTGPIARDSEQERAMISRLKEKKPPGELKETIQLPVLSDLIGRCWDVEPLSRPTAKEVADALQDILVQESSKTDEGPEFAGIFSNGPTVPETMPPEKARAIGQAWPLIRRARHLNVASAAFIQSPVMMPPDSLRALLDSDKWDALSCFVTGAIIFWRLADIAVDNLLDSENQALGGSAEVRRATIALSYLESAARLGFEEAYFEMYKAHARIAREFKAKIKSSIEAARKWKP